MVPEEIDFSAKLDGAGNGVVNPIEMPKNPALEACTCAAKPLGGGHKGDLFQAMWLHSRGEFQDFPGLSIGFLKNFFREVPSKRLDGTC